MAVGDGLQESPAAGVDSDEMVECGVETPFMC